MIFQWKDGARAHGLKAQAVGEHLERLRESHGILTANLVVDDAKAPSSPIHKAFEWNDLTAAREYRLVQARDLLRSVVVVVEGASEDTTPTRAFVVVSTGDDDVFTSLHVAMADASMRAELVARALKELQTWQRKYQELKELSSVFKAIEDIKA